MAKPDIQKLYAEAVAWHRQGKLERAEKLYREILKYAPNAAGIHNSHGAALAAMGREREAADAFLRVTRLEPDNPQAYNNLGNVFTELGRYAEAIQNYQAAIRIQPGYIAAHYHLGLALKANGNLAEAKAQFQRVLELQPGHANALNSMGLVLKEEGGLEEAIDCFNRAIALAPALVEARMNLGLVYVQMEKWAEAIEQFYRTCEIRPNFLEAFEQLGGALLKDLRYEDAIECFGRGWQISPASQAIHIGMGNALLEMNRVNEAVVWFEKALDLPGNLTKALSSLAKAREAAGEHDAAVAVYLDMIARAPDAPEGYIGLAAARKMRPEDSGFLAKVEASLEQQNMSPVVRSSAHFALGKMYDDLKRYDEAFAHYASGNALRNAHNEKTMAIGEEQQHDKFARLIAAYDSQFFASHSDIGNVSSQPVLVVGMPRSGTTLMEQIIASHPQARGAGEVIFWGGAATSLATELATSVSYPECISLLDAVACERIAQRYLKELHKFSGSPQAARIVDKMPHNFVGLGLISTVFPRASIIHIKRDAMDNCLSIFFQNFFTGHHYAYDLGKLGRHYKEYERLMQHWREVLLVPMLEVQYEDLVKDQEQVTRKVIDFIGLPWDDRCLQPQNAVGKVIRTASIWQARQPVYKTSVARWKHYEKHLGPLKESLGYKG